MIRSSCTLQVCMCMLCLQGCYIVSNSMPCMHAEVKDAFVFCLLCTDKHIKHINVVCCVGRVEIQIEI